jgi:hypothetical protein
VKPETVPLGIGHRPVDARLRESLTPWTPNPRRQRSSVASSPGAHDPGASTIRPDGWPGRRLRRRRWLHKRFLNPGLRHARDRGFQGPQRRRRWRREHRPRSSTAASSAPFGSVWSAPATGLSSAIPTPRPGDAVFAVSAVCRGTDLPTLSTFDPKDARPTAFSGRAARDADAT